jgi:hypothetical protein
MLNAFHRDGETMRHLRARSVAPGRATLDRTIAASARLSCSGARSTLRGRGARPTGTSRSATHRLPPSARGRRRGRRTTERLPQVGNRPRRAPRLLPRPGPNLSRSNRAPTPRARATAFAHPAARRRHPRPCLFGLLAARISSPPRLATGSSPTPGRRPGSAPLDGRPSRSRRGCCRLPTTRARQPSRRLFIAWPASHRTARWRRWPPRAGPPPCTRPGPSERPRRSS